MNSLVRRHVAARRTPPLDCGHRDPLLCRVQPDHPSGFSLTAAELAAEVKRCRARGFAQWEIRRVFVEVGTR